MRSALGCGSSTVASGSRLERQPLSAKELESRRTRPRAPPIAPRDSQDSSGREPRRCCRICHQPNQWPVYPMTTAITNTAPASIGHRAARGGATSAVSFAASLRSCAASAILAARRAASGTDCPALSSRGTPDVRPAAPAAASRGWVIVASKARLRAALQSRHNFAPGRLSRPQMRHFMTFRAHFSVLAVPEIGHRASSPNPRPKGYDNGIMGACPGLIFARPALRCKNYAATVAGTLGGVSSARASPLSTHFGAPPCARDRETGSNVQFWFS